MMKPLIFKTIKPPAICLLLFLLLPVFSREEEDVLNFQVTATKETTQQMEVITKERIEALQAADAAEVLEKILHLPVSRYGPHGNLISINMRGFGSGRVAVLIDGVPANSPQNGGFDISLIDVDSIESLEVIYGGSDSKFNVDGAIGGVINIITVKKQKKGFRIGGGLFNTSYLPGTYNTQAGEEPPMWQDLADTQRINIFSSIGKEAFSWSAGASASRAANHFLYKDYHEIVRRRDNNQIYDLGLNTSFVWELPEQSRLILNGDISYADKGISGPITSSGKDKQKDFSTRQNLMADFPRAWHDNFAMEASLSHNWNRQTYMGTTADSLHNLNTLTAINRWTWFFKDTMIFSAGADYRFSRLDSTNTGLKNGHDGGIYLTGEFLIREKILLVPSLKLQSDFRTMIPVPKLGLVWYVSDGLTLKNNWFRSFKFPNFNDLYWTGDIWAQGNPGLKPEDGFGADIIGEFRFKDWLEFQAAFYTAWMRDSIHWRSSGGIWKPENVGEAAFFGFDTKANIKLRFFKPFKKAALTLSYHFLLSYILTGNLTFGSGIRMPYQPMYTAGFSLELPWKSGSLLLTGHFESLRYTETLNIKKLPAFFRLDLSFNQRINPNFSIFAGVNNVFNTSYITMEDYPMPGFNFTLGLKAVYDSDKPKS